MKFDGKWVRWRDGASEDGGGIDDLMKFPVAEKISPIFVGAETKKGRAPQLLTESAGTHPPATQGTWPKCKNLRGAAVDQDFGQNKWVSLWERGLFLFSSVFFVFCRA